MAEVEIPLSKSGSRRYPHAPIVEAALEMRVDLPEGSLARLQGLGASEPEYAEHQPFTEVTGTFDVQAGGVSTQATQRVTGHVWRTSDERRHVQARQDAFLFGQRAPYKHWDEFVGEAERLWLRYKEIAKPIKLHLIGTRFVNRIDIPYAQVELSEYLLTTAEVPPDLPQLISAYLLHMELPEVRRGVECRIISTIIAPSEPDVTSLILDIDVWSKVSLDPSAERFDDEVRERLTELRRAKNDVFEACITTKTRRLFL